MSVQLCLSVFSRVSDAAHTACGKLCHPVYGPREVASTELPSLELRDFWLLVYDPSGV